MIETVIIDGGIGNNLFQMYHAWNLKRRNTSKQIAIYASENRSSTELEYLCDLSELLGLKFEAGSDKMNAALSSLVRARRALTERKLFSGQRRNFSKINLLGIKIHCGYWQSVPFYPSSHCYFDGAISETLPTDAVDEPIVHLRGGDYMTKTNRKIYRSLNSDYFSKAFKLVDSLRDTKSFHYVTNEQNYAQSILTNFDKKFISRSGENSISDFCEISRHTTIVASNSTFCWWATRLGLHKGRTKLIVAPKHWLNKGYLHRSHPTYSCKQNETVITL